MISPLFLLSSCRVQLNSVQAGKPSPTRLLQCLKLPSLETVHEPGLQRRAGTLEGLPGQCQRSRVVAMEVARLGRGLEGQDCVLCRDRLGQRGLWYYRICITIVTNGSGKRNIAFFSFLLFKERGDGK